MKLSEKLASLNITLPALTGTFGTYVPAKRVGNLIYVSGQLPTKDGKLLVTGPVPSKCSVEDARVAARQCVINALGAINALIPGGIDSIKQVVRLGAFIASEPSFTQQPQVANAASEFLIELLGDAGKHVRAAVGTNVLPLEASVEIEFIFEAK